MASSASPEVRDEFPAFPFEPYPVQLRFMKEIYGSLQRGGVVVAESPTGTGKTLSLICSVLQWLQDRRSSQVNEEKADSSLSIKDEDNTSVNLESEPQWLREFCKPNSGKQPKNATKNVKRKAFSSKILNISSDKKDPQVVSSHRDNGNVVIQDQDQDEEMFLLDEYDSAAESDFEKNSRKRKVSYTSDGSSDEEVDLEEEEDVQPMKVFFCSRTHSQLSQFVKELQRTVFSSSLKAVTLGSRKSLCINPDVQKLGHPSRINERCLELQRNSSNRSAEHKLPAKKSHGRKTKCTGCPFMKKKDLQRRFKEHAWESEVLDIEDLVQLGQGLGTCPYYGSRHMIQSADLVIMPYQSLLHHQTRESLGVKLDGCVVVIDEAHNLVDSISDMHSCQISFSQLNQVKLLLSIYLSKFREMLSAGNRRYIQTLLTLIEAFLNRLVTGNDKCGRLTQGNETLEMLTINDFLFSLDIDNVNMFKLCEYMKSSKIIHKVCGYAERLSFQKESSTCTNKGAKEISDELSGSFTGFHALAELVLTLMMADSDGRILVHSRSSNEQCQGYIKFIMLNAAQAFSEVLEKTHAVVLAGGTLQPIEELEYRLYPCLKRNQIHFFSCGHIVPPENVLAIAVSHGPTGRSFDFTYQSRALPEMVEELGRLVFNLSLVVPEGMVIFLPSFEYEQQLHSAWKVSGILDKIQRKKVLFREPRDAASLDITLRKYKEAVTDTQNLDSGRTGAIILCVVGGKMSEGINFSDGMGRCVVMVGLPYPSLSDPELVERMKYVDMILSVPTDRMPEGCELENTPLRGYNGRTYYENLCMKAVNQSIGRAIRHIKDYASIVLVDARYTSSSSITSGPTSKLPTWIKEQLIIATGSFGEVHKRIHQFFRKKQGDN